MSSLRKNTASQNITFQLNAKSDGSPVTSGGAGNVTIDNGTQTSCAGTFTHKGSGQWNYAPTQGETNGTNIGFQFTGTGAIAVNLNFYTDNWDTTAAVVTAGTGTNQLTTSSGQVTVGTNNDKTGYSLSQSFPANFSSLAITAGGAVTAGTVSDKTGYALTAAYDAAKTASQAGDAMTLTSAYNFAKGTTAMTESYASLHSAPTPVQILFEMRSILAENNVATTTVTTKKIDGSTTAGTYTLNSSTAPTSITRAS